MKSKKTGKPIFSGYRSLKSDRVSELIMEVLGCEADDAFDTAMSAEFPGIGNAAEEEEELEEERAAVPEDLNQEFLVAYFEGHVPLGDAVVEAYRLEKSAESPNYPLIRRYYRQGNPTLKGLLLKALDQSPTDRSLLHDLAFFHEHHGMLLSELIDRYMFACKHEDTLESFVDLAIDFYYNTIGDGFEALYELKERLQDDAQKQAVIEQLMDAHEPPDWRKTH
jgi:hypothetical protein